MVNLMGLTVRDAHNPDGDIEIEYTGLRTAEKLFEELADWHERHRYRSPDDHASDGAPPALAADAADAERPDGGPREFRLSSRARAAGRGGSRIPAERRNPRLRVDAQGRAAAGPAAKVADFAAKRRHSEVGKPAPGPSPLPS